MVYWRMQLHDSDKRGYAIKYCVESLAAGYIGLDFHKDPGDLSVIKKEDPDYKDKLPGSESRCWVFAHEMKKGDIVLVMAHHFPFALVKIVGDYNYIKHTENDSPVMFWFKHFRAVKVLDYYADYIIRENQKQQKIQMTDTIQKLADSSRDSYKLIEKWLHIIK